MEYQFQDFDTAHFRAEPRRTAIGPWTVQHMSFGTPATADRAPLVFIGGAFQNAWSFLREVKHFLPQRPVILVDLPGQGQNNQLAEQLTFTDFAGLLRAFLDEHGLRQVIPVGLSYGSGIAYTFALQAPDRVDRLILGGTTERIRPRVQQSLLKSFWYLERGRSDVFADMVIGHLLNLPQREATGVSDRLINAMRMGMLELTEVELVRYRHNSTRLFREELGGHPACRTLVFTASYDHFTAPFEGLAVAKRCPRAEFALIEKGDHLAPVENPRVAIALYDAFVNDRPLTGLPGVLTGMAAAEATRERRLLPRRDGRRREVTLRRDGDAESHAALLDYNAHGCLLAPLNGALPTDVAEPVHVSIPSIGAEGAALLLADARGARAVFLHDAFNTLGKMPVMTVEMATPSQGVPVGRRMSIGERLAAIPDE